MTGGIEAVVGAVLPRLKAAHPQWQLQSISAFPRPSFLNSIPLFGDIWAAVILWYRTRRDDLVIVNGAEYVWPRLLNKCMRKRTIVVWHGTRDYEIQSLTSKRGLLLWIYSASQHFLAKLAILAPMHISVSPKVVDEIHEAYKTSVPIRVIVNGAPQVENIGSAVPKHGKRRILWIGTNAYKKGLDIAVSAVSLLRQKISDVELHIAGLENLPFESVPEWVVCHGRATRKQMSELFQKSDVVCFTTRYEGCSVAVLEAMAYGIPIVASSAVTWMLGESSSAPEGSAEIAVRLDKLLNSPDESTAAIQKQREAVKAFDWDTATTAYADAILAQLSLLR